VARAGAADGLHRGELSVLAGGLFAVVGVMALRVRGTGVPFRVDHLASDVVGSLWVPRPIATSIGGMSTTRLVNLFVGWGTLALAGALVLGMAVAAWRRNDRWGVGLSLVALPVAVTLTDGLAKPVIGRYHGDALAFPSGHATAAMAAATVVIVLLNRWYGWRRALHWSPVVALLPVVTGVGIVRLDWHYPTDVVGGVALGAAVVMALAALEPGPRPLRACPRDE